MLALWVSGQGHPAQAVSLYCHESTGNLRTCGAKMKYKLFFGSRELGQVASNHCKSRKLLYISSHCFHYDYPPWRYVEVKEK